MQNTVSLFYYSTAQSVYYASQARTAPGERNLGVQSVLENCSHVLREQALFPGPVFLPKSGVWLLGDNLVEIGLFRHMVLFTERHLMHKMGMGIFVYLNVCEMYIVKNKIVVWKILSIVKFFTFRNVECLA